MNLIRNGDFEEWPNGTSFVKAGGASTDLISGDLSFVKVGASQPAVTLSRQEHGVMSSIRQGFPRYFLRAAPATAPVLGVTDAAYLTYAYTDDLDRKIAQGSYGIFTFWARTSVNREIVVRFQRTFGSGGHTAQGATSAVFATQSIQLTTGWKKYQVEARFTVFPGATYVTGGVVEARIYLQGGSTELGVGTAIPWTTATVDISQVSFSLKDSSEAYEAVRISGGGSSSETTIYVTDPAFGAVGNYTGTQNTAGTGTDNRAAIQAALDSAYTQGTSYADTTQNTSYRVVVPKGKYYISAPADGTPSLRVPLGVVLDFAEAELHFDRPPLDTVNTFGHGISEPNPLWCGIIIGEMSGLVIGKMMMKPNQDQTYGGAWYGMNLDAIRVQESVLNFISGGGRSLHNILGFRGAAIRCLATYNTWISDLHVAACCFGVVQSYFGTAYAGYTRYRGNTPIENVCTSIFIHDCAFTNIYKIALAMGVDGDYHTPAAGGLEVFSFVNQIGGGPVSIRDCAFENIAEDVLRALTTGSVFMTDIRIERSGWTNTLGTINASSCRQFSLKNISWQQEGGTVYQASYTGPLALITPNPGTFVRVNATNVSPHLENIYINNLANLACQLVNGDNNITRLPTVKNYRCEVATQMQGTNAGYMQNIIIENDGGREFGVSTTGLLPTATPNGVLTTFTFLNGFTRQKPKRIIVDGVTMEATDAAGTNWTWNTGTTDVTFTVAPTKSIRAFF